MPAPAAHVLSLEEEQALHRRLVERDPTASADLIGTFLDPLISLLVERNSSRVPEELCIEAAEDALMDLAKSPASFDPARGKRLGGYLRMSAQRDLQNKLRKEGRHRRRRISLDDVELPLLAGKYLAVDDDPSRPLELEEESSRARHQVVAPARDGLTEGESRALDLLLQGERKTTMFAEALGIEHLPASEQRADVKRVKDKLKKRIQRQRSGDGEPS
jgi:RNA polymerase sigma-70 factor (ECF subfamily)